jgi:hypothetical protein
VRKCESAKVVRSPVSLTIRVHSRAFAVQALNPEAINLSFHKPPLRVLNISPLFVL